MKSTILKYCLVFLFILSTKTIKAQKCDSIKTDGVVNHYLCPLKAINAWCKASKIIESAVLNPMYNNPAYSTEVIGTGAVDPVEFAVCPNYAPCGEERRPALFLAGDFEIEYILLYSKSPIGMTMAEIEEEKQKKLQVLYITDKLVMKVRNTNNAITDEEYDKVSGLLGNIEGEANQKEANNYFKVTIFFNSIEKEVFHFIPQYTVKESTPFMLPNVKPLLAMDITHYLKFYDPKNLDREEKYIDEPLLRLYDSYVRLGSYLSEEASEKMRLNGDYSIRNITVKVTGSSFEANHKILREINWTKLLEAIK